MAGFTRRGRQVGLLSGRRRPACTAHASTPSTRLPPPATTPATCLLHLFAPACAGPSLLLLLGRNKTWAGCAHLHGTRGGRAVTHTARISVHLHPLGDLRSCALRAVDSTEKYNATRRLTPRNARCNDFPRTWKTAAAPRRAHARHFYFLLSNSSRLRATQRALLSWPRVPTTITCRVPRFHPLPRLPTCRSAYQRCAIRQRNSKRSAPQRVAARMRAVS